MSIAADAGTQMPAGTALGLGALMIVSGGLLVGVGWAAATGRLRRNWFAGIRTTASMSSDEAWDACHRAGGRLMAAGGVASVVCGLPLLLRPSNGVGLTFVVVGLVAVLVMTIWSGLVGNRAAKAVISAERDGGTAG
ncbi:MAG: SdpI family protein [Acidimicrobiales bacterium]|nr:SdpI family protein [Acidimicrobiales bacterium]MCB9392188.1 SdpI family protein [Acidimicrobiaceae bacterium]